MLAQVIQCAVQNGLDVRGGVGGETGLLDILEAREEVLDAPFERDTEEVGAYDHGIPGAAFAILG